jgi:hypothetical protein
MAIALWLRWRLAPKILLIWYSLAALGGCLRAIESQDPIWASFVAVVAGASMLFGWFNLLMRGTTVASLVATVLFVLAGHAVRLFYLPALIWAR